jgi:hypothetical protein
MKSVYSLKSPHSLSPIFSVIMFSPKKISISVFISYYLKKMSTCNNVLLGAYKIKNNLITKVNCKSSEK